MVRVKLKHRKRKRPEELAKYDKYGFRIPFYLLDKVYNSTNRNFFDHDYRLAIKSRTIVKEAD